MSKENQIKEVAKVIDKSHWKLEQDFTGCHINSSEIAEYLYNAGYRKQSDVVMEIFDDILKIKGLELHDWEAIFELKKKYTDGR